MEPLKISMRSDLNMRTGKMASQSGHAAMLLVVSRLRNEPDHLRLSAKDLIQLRAFVQDPQTDTVLVSGQNDLIESVVDSRANHMVIDNGATEFKGVKTMTCGAAGIFSEACLSHPIAVADSGSQPTVRQYFVFSRETEFNKKTACSMAGIGTVTDLEKLLKDDPQGSGDGLISRAGNERFFEWILNGYPKIGLQAKSHDDLLELHTRLKGDGLRSTLIRDEDHLMLCTGPEYMVDLSPFTSGFKLL
jgi:peptidyl-tRNA hydrolase